MPKYKDTNEMEILTEAIINGFSAEREIQQAIEAVQKSDVFFSKIIASMKVMASTSGKTMSTDGKNLFYNPNFVKELINNSGMNESVQGIIVHEILHIAFGHHIAFAKELDRAVETNNKHLKWLVNVACDLAINSFLFQKPGFPKDVFIPGYNPNEEPFKSFPKDKDARWYYNQLIDFYKNKPEEQPQEQDNQPQDPQKNPEDDESESGGESGEGSESGDESGDESGEGSGSGDESGDESGEGSGSGEGEGSESGDGSGSGVGKGSESGDGSGSGSGTGDDLGTGNDSGRGGNSLDDAENIKNIPEDLLDKYKNTGEIEAPQGTGSEDVDNLKQQHDQDMKEFQKDAEKIEKVKRERGIGSSGGAYSNIDYAKLIKDQSRIPWNQIINEFLSENEQGETTYRIPSRRSHGLSFDDFYSTSDEQIITPSRFEEKLNELLLIVDVSGSNREAANGVFPEIREAINSSGFGNESSFRLVSFNTKIEDEYVFSFNPKDYVSLKNPNQMLPREKVIIPDGNDLIKDADIDRFEWNVGGGTSIGPVFDALNQLKEAPPFIVILTDGEFYQHEIDMLNKGKFKFKIIWIMTHDNDIKFQGYKTYNLYDMDY